MSQDRRAQHDPEGLFARLLLHYQLADRETVEAGLAVVRAEGGLRGLAEVLVEQGKLAPERAEQVRRIQREMLEKEKAATMAAAAVAPAVPEPVPAPAPSPVPAAVTPPPAAPVPGFRAAPAAPSRRLDQILELAVRHGASDLHIHAGSPILARRQGELTPLGANVLTPEQTARLIDEILGDAERTKLASSGQVDFAYSLPGFGRFRANAYRQQRGVDAVFRAIPPKPPTLAELHLPESLARLTEYHQGLVLFTGPAGCGKSSTMAALVRRINEERSDHLITIEDPIEYLHASERAVVNQRQVGPHTGSFARALRAALREDPDVIVIGELRDLETISLALSAAETGHLVFGSLHTANAIRTVNRLVGAFPPSQQSQIRVMVSESLRAVVSQRLVNRADGVGRVPALEVLMGTKAVGNMIREAKTFQLHSVLQTGQNAGMVLLDVSLQSLVKAGTITIEEARRHAEEPARFGGTPRATEDAVGAGGAEP